MKHSKIFLILITSFYFLLFACQKEPNVSFTASKTSTIPDQAIYFTNTTTNAEYYEWDFGDGKKSNEKEPSHFYTAQKEYMVTLTAYSKNGNKSNSVSQKIAIGPAPACAFTYSPRYPKPGETVHFIDNSTNNATSWSWDFGDGTTSIEKSPNHIFDVAKTYNLSLTVTNIYSTYKETDSIILLNQAPIPPTPYFTYIIGQNFNVNFQDTSAGNPTKWYWSFGDGATSIEQNPIHHYSHGGLYFVTLRVFNLAGSSQIIKTVNLPNNFPVANFIYSEGENYTITFQDMSTGEPYLWEWTFGDGATSNEQNPIHQYTQMGTYPVSLKVTNNSGSNQITHQINVSNSQYTFLVGNYTIVDNEVKKSLLYNDQIIATEIPTKFYTGRFGNYENGNVYFSVNGTVITVPIQIVHCGTPPNDFDHTFNGTGNFTNKNGEIHIQINYYDSYNSGVSKHNAKYTKISKSF
jgi:PKD repeat protein